MKFRHFFISFFLLVAASVFAQHDAHDHSGNELGLSSGAIYGIDDKQWGTGTHLHYFRSLGDHSKWALGGFFEYAWLEGNHYALGLGARFEPISRVHLGVFPGVAFLKHQHEEEHQHQDQESSKARFSIHGEIVYDLLSWKNMHFGPVIDYSWSKDDSHAMLGVHAAYCF